MYRQPKGSPVNARARIVGVPALLVLLLGAACSARFTQTLIPWTGKPTQGGAPTATGPATTLPQALAARGLSISQQAPICQATASCAALNAEQIPLECVKKVPYTNVLVPSGTTFQVLDASGDFACIDSGVVVNGKQVLTCHGRELYSFQIKLTNSACQSTLDGDTGRCSDGYGYDAANQCCAPAGADAEGSATVSINLGACPLPGP